MSLSDDQLNHLISAADPAGAPNTTALDEAWARVSAECDSAPVSRLRHRRRVIGVAIVAVAAAAAAALTAAAPFVATRTGQQNPPDWVSAGGPGEDYRLNGSDFAEQLAALGTDIPYPDQASREFVLSNMVAEYADSTESVQASTGALRADLARSAICAWTRTWQSANTAGDVTLRQTSTDALAGALTWKAVTDVDRHPSATGHKMDLGGRGPTVFGELPGMISAARLGQAATLAKRVDATGYCVYNDKREPPKQAERPNGLPKATSWPVDDPISSAGAASLQKR